MSQTANAQDEGTSRENVQASENPASEINNDAQRVFLNPTAQDTMLSNLLNGSYNTSALSGNKGIGNSGKREQEKEQPALSPSNAENSNMAVATRDPMMTINRLNSV